MACAISPLPFNAGRSLHAHPLLFNAADLPAEHFPTSTLGDSVQVAITTVSALSAHYGHVTVLHRETGNGAFLVHASLLPAPALVTPRPAVPASGPPGFGASNLDDFILPFLPLLLRLSAALPLLLLLTSSAS
jgi:hypothetical protein